MFRLIGIGFIALGLIFLAGSGLKKLATSAATQHQLQAAAVPTAATPIPTITKGASVSEARVGDEITYTIQYNVGQ